MIWLLGIGRMLSRALSAAWEFIRTNPALCAVIALGVLSAVLWQRGERYRDKLLAANAQIEAGKQNVVALKAEKARIEKRQAETTERIDHETKPARVAALAAADDYARTHRCVRSPGPVSASGQSGGSVPGVPAATVSAEAAGETASMVAVPKWGIDACSLNSADLQKAYEWAQSISQP